MGGGKLGPWPVRASAVSRWVGGEVSRFTFGAGFAIQLHVRRQVRYSASRSEAGSPSSFTLGEGVP